MFKYTIILFLIIYSPIVSSAQIFQNEACGYNEHSIFANKLYVDIEEINLFLDSCNYNPSSDDIKYRIPVKFWIYRKSDGTGGLTKFQIKEHIRNLNYFYSINNIGISFYLRPDVEYIDSDRLHKLNYYNQAPLQTFKNKSDACINVYVTEKLEKERLFKIKKNYSGTYNSFTDGVIIARGVSSTTLSHEIGHYFGLKHPHSYWKSKIKGEPVSRTKLISGTNTRMCEKKGDGLCDTPAEPNLAKYTDDKCNYTGWNVKDKYGVVYKPATNNIMSYTQNRDCRTNFTEEQKALILYTASKKKYAKQWSTSNVLSDNNNFDYFEPDNLKETASEIFFRTIQTHTFHKIYTKNNKYNFKDDVDWLYFNLNIKKSKTIKVILSKSKYDFPNLLITVYKKDKEIFKIKVENENVKEFLINKLTKGKYLIKIQKISTKSNITGYKIKLDNSYN